MSEIKAWIIKDKYFTQIRIHEIDGFFEKVLFDGSFKNENITECIEGE